MVRDLPPQGTKARSEAPGARRRTRRGRRTPKVQRVDLVPQKGNHRRGDDRPERPGDPLREPTPRSNDLRDLAPYDAFGAVDRSPFDALALEQSRHGRAEKVLRVVPVFEVEQAETAPLPRHKAMQRLRRRGECRREDSRGLLRGVPLGLKLLVRLLALR